MRSRTYAFIVLDLVGRDSQNNLHRALQFLSHLDFVILSMDA